MYFVYITIFVSGRTRKLPIPLCSLSPALSNSQKLSLSSVWFSLVYQRWMGGCLAKAALAIFLYFRLVLRLCLVLLLHFEFCLSTVHLLCFVLGSYRNNNCCHLLWHWIEQPKLRFLAVRCVKLCQSQLCLQDLAVWCPMFRPLTTSNNCRKMESSSVPAILIDKFSLN